MHNRKTFIVYPPDYDPDSQTIGLGYNVFKSLGKAKKEAFRKGPGSQIYVMIHHHEGKFKFWTSSEFNFVGETV